MNKLSFPESGTLVNGDTTYKALTLRGRKLILEKTTRTGINVSDVKTEQIERKIAKNGTIRLLNTTVNVLDIAGVAFHLNGDKNVSQ